jgi:hypothetical protein
MTGCVTNVNAPSSTARSIASDQSLVAVVGGDGVGEGTSRCRRGTREA